MFLQWLGNEITRIFLFSFFFKDTRFAAKLVNGKYHFELILNHFEIFKWLLFLNRMTDQASQKLDRDLDQLYIHTDLHIKCLYKSGFYLELKLLSNHHFETKQSINAFQGICKVNTFSKFVLRWISVLEVIVMTILVLSIIR